MRPIHINRKSRDQQRIKHKEIDSHIKTHFPNHAVVCTTCRKSYKWLKTCETHQSKTGCCKTIALDAATLSQGPVMAAGLRIHDEPSNRTGFGTIAADLHDIAPIPVDGAVEGDVAAGGANAAVAVTGSATNMPAAPATASKHKRKKGKAVQHGAASDKGSSEDVLASDTESSDQIRGLLPKIREGKTVCWVKEHRTSKCCSTYGKEMQQAVLHKQLPPTEDELKAWARSKQDRQIKRKAHLLVKLAHKHIQQDNQQAVPLSISLRLLPITQDEADMAIKFARSGANAARQQTNRKRLPPRPGDGKLSRLPPVSVKPQLRGADLVVARNYDAKNLLMPWGVRHRGHCDTIWCRDKNACINMHKCAMLYLRQPLKDDAQGMTLREDGPPYSRPQQQHSQIRDKVAEVRARLSPLIKRIKAGELETAQGVSLLEVRLHTMLGYITNLGFLSLLKLHGQSISGHPVVDRLIELRTVLERTKPLEQKLKYQIDKLIKAAVMHEDSQRMGEDMGDTTDAALSVKNPLQFKPNPAALAGDAGDAGSDNGKCISAVAAACQLFWLTFGNAFHEDGAGKAKEDEPSGVYRPPRVAPMMYDDSSNARRGRLSQQLKERATKSRMLGDLQAEFDDRPEEMDAEGTGYGARGRARTKEDERMLERQEFEEANFIRLSLSKKDKKMQRDLQTRGHLMRFQNEFRDLDADFRDLADVHHAVEQEDDAKYGKGLAGKRNKRAEKFAEASASKRARFESTEDMIKTAARTKRSQMGKDAFRTQKRIVKRFGGPKK
ncbi:hypothetical protein HK105_206795 [Polyrhizophydium stewartii]|uniref:Uncharacterized protein n=1 Tax=Polyrhizophydium stewartii TaxID=2732419 RepID=A0ABR4N291_9FUNG